MDHDNLVQVPCSAKALVVMTHTDLVGLANVLYLDVEAVFFVSLKAALNCSRELDTILKVIAICVFTVHFHVHCVVG